jgi:hypothetical protein
VVELSEPVVGVEGASLALTQNPFDYVLKSYQASTDWRHPDFGANAVATYQPSYLTVASPSGASTGDSIVSITYEAYRGELKGQTPELGDSVRVFRDDAGTVVFKDLAGNAFNPREIGVEIEGTVAYEERPVLMGELDPDRPGRLQDAINGNPELAGVPQASKDALFAPDRPAEWLPLPDVGNDSIAKAWYPGTAGVIIRPDVRGEAKQACNAAGISDTDCAAGITLYAQAYYSTSVGDFTAHRKSLEVKCNDPLFLDENGNGNCLTNKNTFYLAWDLKSDQNRFVGSGVYVMVYKFHWTYTVADGKVVQGAGGKETTRKLGVRRVKAGAAQ